jgi:hypothetical protein
MRLSDDKTNHLSHVLVKSLREYRDDDDNDMDFKVEDNQVRLTIKGALVECLETFEELEEKVKKTVSSYSRKIVEGSREWDLMYSKTYEEEIQKLKGV